MGEALAVFQSILHPSEGVQHETPRQPDFFSDLNLDQIIEAMTAHKEEYNLQPFFWTPLRDPDSCATARRSCGISKMRP
jgi:DNA mismatch repair protein MutS